MRRAAAVATGGLIALLGMGATAGAAPLEPVTITATAPESVTAGTPFDLEVEVQAEAGALGIAAQPLRVQVKLAPECGGSFAGTEGPTALDRQLPAPGAGAYSQTVGGKVTMTSPGTDIVCAFLDDAQERQFATDTEAELSVRPASATGAGGAVGAAGRCPVARKQLRAAKHRSKRLERRIRKVKRKLRHAHGAHRRALARKLRKLRAHERKAMKRRRQAAHAVAGACS